jgi:hypothetical protein
VSLLARSYHDQLVFLERQIEAIRQEPGYDYIALHMLLSLAESVKQARRHNLNCRKVPNGRR